MVTMFTGVETESHVHLTQYFRGYLAGLSILKGKTESDRVIRCLNDCKEKLDFHAMSEMESGMVSIHFS